MTFRPPCLAINTMILKMISIIFLAGRPFTILLFGEMPTDKGLVPVTDENRASHFYLHVL